MISDTKLKSFTFKFLRMNFHLNSSSSSGLESSIPNRLQPIQ